MTQTLLEMIDTRAFSNLWFWVLLALSWWAAGYWVLGVPSDLIQRARQERADAEHDMLAILGVSVPRLLSLRSSVGLGAFAGACFLFSCLCVLGFYYGIELAQALFLLGLPLTLAFALTLHTAAAVAELTEPGDALYGLLARHRLWTHILGLCAIGVTALWGTYRSFTLGVLG